MLEEMLRKGKTQSFYKTDYRGVTDVWEVVCNMETAWKLPAGIYNFGSPACGSIYEIVRDTMEEFGAEGLVEALEGSNGPRNLCMAPEKTLYAGIHFLSAREGLEHYLKDRKNTSLSGKR